MRLSTLATALNAKHIGKDTTFSRVSIDTRTLQKDDCYIAIRGDRYDGHDFIAIAEQKGASACIVSAEVTTKAPQLRVADTRAALMALAHFYRAPFDIPFVAITGSCGKTTTRAMLANILSQVGDTLSSQRSFNNDIGVPLTLLQLHPMHRYAVIEMGANHAGEIATLTQIVQPTVAMITLAGSAHLAGFGDIEGVARAKGEIFQGLQPQGIAIINQEDAYAHYWKSCVRTDCRVITFGYTSSADVVAQNVQMNAQAQPMFALQIQKETTFIRLPLMGRHNVMNALAAAAAAHALDVPTTAIQAGLEIMTPVAGRLVEKTGLAGAAIIDDSYNANPDSVKAAIQILSQRSGRSILVLGDMLELGVDADQLHYAIGKYALTQGVHRLFCYGAYSAHAAKAFGKNAQHFSDKKNLILAVQSQLSQQHTVLIKGSNGMGMGDVAQALMGE